MIRTIFVRTYKNSRLFNVLLCSFFHFIIWLSLLSSFLQAAENQELTVEEKKWLANHQIIRLGVDPDWAPFDFIDKHGNHQGVAADYLRLIEKKLGIKIELVKDISWTEVLDLAKAKSLDLVSIAAVTPDSST